jgi:CHASE1-domain containing sensor protein
MMRVKPCLLLGALLMLTMLHATLAQDENQHCTAIGFGRKATVTGATMIAHTDDR